MGHDWILSVLTDLKTYAEQNGLGSLAGQLDDTLLVAQADITGVSRKAPILVTGDSGTSGHISREAGVR